MCHYFQVKGRTNFKLDTSIAYGTSIYFLSQLSKQNKI